MERNNTLATLFLLVIVFSAAHVIPLQDPPGSGDPPLGGHYVSSVAGSGVPEGSEGSSAAGSGDALGAGSGGSPVGELDGSSVPGSGSPRNERPNDSSGVRSSDHPVGGGSIDPHGAGSSRCHCSSEGRTCSPGPTRTGQQLRQQHLLVTDASTDLCVHECSVCSSDERNDKGGWKRNDNHFAVPLNDVDISPRPSSVASDFDYENIYYEDFEEQIYSNLHDLDTGAVVPLNGMKTISSFVNGSLNEIEAIMVRTESPKERREAMNLLSAIYATLLAYVRVAEVFDWKTFESQVTVADAPEIKVTNNVSHKKKLKIYLDGTKKRIGRTVAMADTSMVTVETTVTPPRTPLMNKIFKAIGSEARKEPHEEENVYHVTSANEDQDIGIVRATVVSKTSESASDLTPHVSSLNELREQNSALRTFVSTPPDPDHPKVVTKETLTRDSTNSKLLPSSSMQHTTSKTTETEDLQSLFSSTSLLSSPYMCSSVPKQNAHPLSLVSLLKLKYQKNPTFACPDTSQLDSPAQGSLQKPPTPTASQPQSSKNKAKQRSGSKPLLMDLLKPKAHYRGPYKGPSNQKFRPFFIGDWSRAAMSSASASGKKDKSSLEDGAPVPIASLAKSASEDSSVVTEDQNPSNSYGSTDQLNRDHINHLEKHNPGEDSDINSADLTPGNYKRTSASAIINAIDSTNNNYADATVIPSNKNDETGSDEKIYATAAKNKSWVQCLLGLFFG